MISLLDAARFGLPDIPENRPAWCQRTLYCSQPTNARLMD